MQCLKLTRGETHVASAAVVEAGGEACRTIVPLRRKPRSTGQGSEEEEEEGEEGDICEKRGRCTSLAQKRKVEAEIENIKQEKVFYHEPLDTDRTAKRGW